MAIKIQYSADLEDVPQEVARFLGAVCKRMERSVGEIENAGYRLGDKEATDLMTKSELDEEINLLLEFIQEGKKALLRVDDCIAILRGYQQLKFEASPAPEQKAEGNKQEFSDS